MDYQRIDEDQYRKLLIWGDDITRRLDALIERAKPTDAELQEYDRLKSLREQAEEQAEEQRATRHMLAEIFSDMSTQDNKPSAEKLIEKLDKRGRG